MQTNINMLKSCRKDIRIWFRIITWIFFCENSNLLFKAAYMIWNYRCFTTTDVHKWPPHSEMTISTWKIRNMLKKCCPNGAPKKYLSSRVSKFAGKIGIDLALIFSMNDFSCVILSFWDMIDFVFMFSTINLIWLLLNIRIQIKWTLQMKIDSVASLVHNNLFRSLVTTTICVCFHAECESFFF